MEEKSIQVGDDGNDELRLSSEQLWVLEYLDKWFVHPTLIPSNLFRGALVAIDPHNQEKNPDYLAQSANSIRDFFYNFMFYKEPKIKKENAREKIRDKILVTQEEKIATNIADKLYDLYGIFTAIAHHSISRTEFKEHRKILKENFDIEVSSRKDIESVYPQLIEILFSLLKRTASNLIEVFRKIDEVLLKTVEDISKENLDLLLHSNFNAQQYFYAHAPTDWIDWLKVNGYLNILDEASKERMKGYGFRLPHLAYLHRVVSDKKHTQKVVDVIKQIDFSGNFNIEIAQWVLSICPCLNDMQIKEILEKIVQENWATSLNGFNISAYSYEPLVKKLLEQGSSEGLLLLAELLLQVNEEKVKGDYSEHYFYVRDLPRIGLFEALKELEGVYAEKAVEILAGIFSKLIQSEKVFDSAFPQSDSYYINDVDFFNIDYVGKSPYGYREEVKVPLKVFITLIGKVIGGKCNGDALEIYNKYLSSMPDTQTLWRVKLFSMSQCPELFKSNLKKELFKIFETGKYSQLLFGTEYINSLKIVFRYWEESDQIDYLEKFMGLIKAHPDQYWHVEQGWEILSAISYAKHVQDKQHEIESVFQKTLDPKFDPKLHESEIRGGMVQDRSPVKFSEFKEISYIIYSLKNDLTVASLREKYKGDDFLNPRNAEGVGIELKDDVQKRIDDYLKLAPEFLDKEIHIHYTYSFLRGVEDHLRNKNTLSKENWDSLFMLFSKIKDFSGGASDQLGEEDLARWTWLEKAAVQVLQFFLTKTYKTLFEEKRQESIELIGHFLQSEDPKEEHEEEKYGDLFFIAINSTRGVALECLVNFIHMDGEKLKDDVLVLYDKTIKEASLSIRFLLGRHLAPFFFKSEKVKDLLPQIFIADIKDLEKFFASMSGYLTSPIYKELFEAMEESYIFALNNVSPLGAKRERSADVDKGLGSHLALAFSHFDDVEYNEQNKHKLIELMFVSGRVKVQKEFVSFLGRGIISNSKAGKEWFDEQNIKLEKLKKLWEFFLGKNIDEEVYTAFGYWVNLEKAIFDYGWLANMFAKTLEKTRGRIGWDHGIEERFEEFASANPQATIEVIQHLYLGQLVGSQRLNWFQLDGPKIEVFRKLYEAKPIAAKDLINKLLDQGGSAFWPLKDIPDER